MSRRSLSAYEVAVRKLYQVNMWNPVKLGLENVERLYGLSPRPLSVPIVHIAGTNGKGSVAWKISHGMRAAGYKTGLFVSPHVSSFRERMQVDGQLISESSVETLLPKLFALCEEHGVPATFFELTTVLAFWHFVEQRADVVVLECGLGGRLDATNVVTPSLSVITSIGLEHTRILGDTIEAIALEKAGIMKAGVPVLVGPNVPHDVLRAHAERVGSPYFIATDVVEYEGAAATTDFDDENSLIAMAAMRLVSDTDKRCNLTRHHGEQGVRCRPPCRFEAVDVLWDPSSRAASQHPPGGGPRALKVVLDVGHNLPALEQLFAKLERTFPGRSLRIVAGFSRDKDLGGCLELIAAAKNVRALHLVQASHPRAAPAQEVLDLVTERNEPGGIAAVSAEGGVTTGVHAALQATSESQPGGEEVVVVCGSVFIMSEAREALGFDEPKDSDVISEVAGLHLRNSQESFSEEEQQPRK